VKALIIAAAISGALALMGYGTVQIHDVYADVRYVKNETYKQGIEQGRIWKLQDKIDAIRERANEENRGLTTRETERIEKKQEKIDELKGF
jgi:uncharacterized protein HemX